MGGEVEPAPGLLRTDDAQFPIIFACDTEVVVVYWWSNSDFASGEGTSLP